MHISESMRYFSGVMWCIFTIFGATGNLLIILAFYVNKELRKHATTKFVISLAISDFLLCSINAPSNAILYFRDKEYELKICQLLTFFFYANGAVSLLNLVLITFNQYILICHNDKYQKIYTNCKIGIMIGTIYAYVYGMVSLPLFGLWGTIAPKENKHYFCTIHSKNGNNPKVCFL